MTLYVTLVLFLPRHPVFCSTRTQQTRRLHETWDHVDHKDNLTQSCCGDRASKKKRMKGRGPELSGRSLVLTTAVWRCNSSWGPVGPASLLEQRGGSEEEEDSPDKRRDKRHSSGCRLLQTLWRPECRCQEETRTWKCPAGAAKNSFRGTGFTGGTLAGHREEHGHWNVSLPASVSLMLSRRLETRVHMESSTRAYILQRERDGWTIDTHALLYVESFPAAEISANISRLKQEDCLNLSFVCVFVLSSGV